jgi:hypothetical protein
MRPRRNASLKDWRAYYQRSAALSARSPGQLPTAVVSEGGSAAQAGVNDCRFIDAACQLTSVGAADLRDCWQSWLFQCCRPLGCTDGCAGLATRNCW